MRGEVKTNRTKGFWEAPAGWMGGRTRLLGGFNERERWPEAGGLFLVWTGVREEYMQIYQGCGCREVAPM